MMSAFAYYARNTKYRAISWCGCEGYTEYYTLFTSAHHHRMHPPFTTGGSALLDWLNSLSGWERHSIILALTLIHSRQMFREFLKDSI